MDEPRRCVQKDYILIRNRHRNTIKKCKTYPGFDVGSDHNPVVASMSVKLKRTMPYQSKKKEYINWSKLVID